MKVLRLRVYNYRGIAQREIEFAPRGVTIVTGPNEVGKSSLSEAIDLLFDERDDTAKQRVREIQPVDRDEGSEVEVDAVVGPFRFSYAKRYHCKSETRLLVRAPRVEQATGREAHERVRALLDAHLDVALWRALRIVQGAPLDAPALASATSLVAALDRAAGVGAGGEREESLFERARAAYDRHFTPTGRARRGYALAKQAVAAASAEASQQRARLDALERDVDAEAALRARVAELEQRIAADRSALRALEEKLAELAALRAEGERAAGGSRPRAHRRRSPWRSRASADSSSPRMPARRQRWRASRRRSRARRPRTSRPRRSCATWRSGCSRRAARARALRRW